MLAANVSTPVPASVISPVSPTTVKPPVTGRSARKSNCWPVFCPSDWNKNW